MRDNIKPGEITAAITYIFSLAFFLFLVFGLSGCNRGCGFGSGSCIAIGEEPEPPTCAELVADECVEEVIAEFCPPPRVIVVPPGECEPEVIVEVVERIVEVEVVTTVEVHTWTCDDFADRVPGHRPKECRP